MAATRAGARSKKAQFGSGFSEAHLSVKLRKPSISSLDFNKREGIIDEQSIDCLSVARELCVCVSWLAALYSDQYG